MEPHRGARRMLLAISLAAGAVVSLSGVAVAATESTVSLTISDGHQFKGVVSSPAPACVVGRRVNLVRIEPDGSRTVVTHTFTTESGHYATDIPMQSGNRFFARVKRMVTPRGKVCLADRSGTHTV